MRSVQLAVLTTIALAAARGAPAQTKNDTAIALFSSQKCPTCHSIGGKGNKKGPLDAVGAKLTPDDIRQWIVDPDAMREKTNATRTPAMKKQPLNKQQVDALVGYLQTLKTPAPEQ